MTLDEAIAQLIELGEKDPLTIARKIEERHGKDWLLNEIAARVEDYVSDLARRRLSGQRRSAEVALRAGDEVSSSELKIKSFWIPNEGWIRASDLSATHLRARALWEENLMGAIARRVAWLRDVADLMETEGVKKLGQLKKTLPALPELEEAVA